MASHCVNTNSSEFKELLTTTNMNPIKLAAVIADWQEINQTHLYPSTGDLSTSIINTNEDNWNNLDYPQYGNIKIATSYYRSDIERLQKQYGGNIIESKDIRNRDIYKLSIAKPKESQSLEADDNELFSEAKRILNIENNTIVTTPTTTGFQGYKGGFENIGKGTPEGDGKDKAMRQIADSFIGEEDGLKLTSSTRTSAEYIDKYNSNGNNNKATLKQSRVFNQTNTLDVDNYTNTINSIVMLARNGSLSGEPLQYSTKTAILNAHNDGAEFIVGDMPNVDSQFIDYLQEIGAKFTIYHTGTKSRINIDSNQEVSINETYELTKEEVDRINKLVDDYKQSTTTPTKLGLVEFYKKQKLESNQRLANDIIYKLNNPHAKFDYATVTHINKVLSLLAFNRLDKLKELTIGDLRNNTTVKEELIVALGETVQYNFDNNLISEEQYNNIMDNIIDDLDSSNSVLWNNFVNHFAALYNISIIDESNVSSEKGFEDIPIWWDDKQQLKFNVLTSIQSKVKFKLSSLSNGVNDITGLPEVVDLNIIINRLINTHRFDTTDNQFLDNLSNLSKTYPAINALINEFAKRDESGEGWEITDNNYFNAYKSALNYDMAYVSATVINQAQGFTVFDNLISNRYSFIENVDFDTWNENIKINLSNGNLRGLYDRLLNYIKDGNITKISDLKIDKFLNINLNKPTDFFEQLSSLLFSLGITITSDNMQNVYDGESYNALGDKKNIVFYSNVVLPTQRLVIELYNLIADNKTKYITNEKSNLYKLAKFNAVNSNTATQLDYLNIENENVYTPIYQSYVSKHFTNMNSIIDVRRNFEKFTKDAKFKYSNWLWNIDGNGIFNYDENIFNKTGNYVIDEINPVNLDYTSKLTPTFFNGIKLAEESIGLEYSKITGSAWDVICLLNAATYDKKAGSILMNGTYYIPSSDSARIVGIPLNYNTIDRVVSFKEENGQSIKSIDYIKAITLDKESNTWKLRNGSTLHTQIVNTIMQELIDMRRTANRIFDISPSSTLSIKPEFNDAVGLAKLSSPKDWNGKALLVDGKPTGSVFKFSNLTYVVKENGVDKVVTLNDLFTDYSYLTEDVNSPYIQTKINEFIANAINANITKSVSSFKPSIPILMKYSRYGIEGGKTKASKLTKEKLKENALFKDANELTQTIAEYYVTNYLAQVEFGNFINGNINEYSDTLAENKRIGQSIKNGLSTNSNRTYNSLVINDVYVNSPIYDIVKQLSPKHAEQYRSDKGATNSTDAFTFIRLKEGINRAKDFGRYDSYKDIYDDATNPDVIFNPNKYDRLNESHKYFMYGRELDYKLDPTNPRIKSTQDKNSTMVLTPNRVKATQLEDVLNWMDRNNIDELVFPSAHKVGGDKSVTIFDENGYFTEPNIDEVNEAIAVKKVSNLVVQLDIVPHITDEVNKVGVQLEKQILTNINFNDAVYQVYGKDSKLTGNQLKEAYQEVMNADIVELATDLLREFDAIENNETKTTVIQGETIIYINNDKVIKFLQDYVRKNETSEILLKAIDDIIKGQTNLPIYSGLTVTKFTNILNALFTNNVINRKIKGAHLSIIPDIGYNPSNKYITDGEIDFDTYFNDCAIKYTDEFKERCKTNKSVKLGVEKVTINGEDTYYVDTVIAPWETRFYDENGMIDINKLDEDARTMFGIRIPTEGKQSMVVARVVGFLPGGSSQCIMPDFLVTKTGWDFDIDSIYLYFKELELVDGKYTPIKFNDDTKNKEQYKKYINSTKFAANERLKFANKFNAIYNKIEENRNNYLNNPDVNKASIFESYANLFKEKYEYTIGLQQLKDDELQYDIKQPNIEKLIKSELGRINIELNNLIDNYGNEYYEEYLTNRETYKATNIKLYEELESLKSELNTGIESHLSYDKYLSLTTSANNTRAARNNRTIDYYISIATNQEHANEYYRPNEMDNITAVGDWINEKYGFSNKTMNLNNHYDAAKLRDLNMSVRNLKGMSVAFDAIMAILGVEKANLATPIIFKVDKDDTFTAADVNKWKHLFDEVTEYDNYYIIETSNIGNNKAGNWLDVNGLKITEQSSEITSNILDAVKKVMGLNLNEYTLSVFRLLSATPMSSIFNGKANRFLIPYLFIHQPILLSYSNANNIIRSETLKSNSNHAIAKTNKAWHTRLLKASIPLLEEANTDKRYDTLLEEIKKNSKKDAIYLNKYNQNLFDTFIQGLMLNRGTYIKSATELESNIDISFNYNNLTPIDKVQFIVSQLDILTAFKNLNEKAGDITTAISTFNTDKTKVGFEASRKLNRNIMNLLVDKKKLYEDVAEMSNPSYRIKALKDAFTYMDTKDDIKEKIKIYTSVAKSIGIKVSDYSRINANGKPIVEVIYPYLFSDNVDVRSGKYSQIQAYMYSGFNIIDNAWKPLFPTEYGTIYEVKNRLLSGNNLSDNEFASKLINTYIESAFVGNIDFFRSTNNSVILDAYRGRTETVELALAERLLLFGPTADNLNELNINIDGATEDDLNKFKAQTTTTKLKLLLNSEFGKSLKNSPKWNKNHILNFITFADEPKVHQAKGYSTFRINDSGDYGSMKESLTAMLYGYQTNTPQGEMLTIVAEEMIKSHFYLHGINFGRNISKYIDVDLLHEAGKSRNPNKNTLQNYADAVRQLEQQMLPGRFVDNFYKANANNSLFVKQATPTYNYDGSLDSELPTFTTIGESVGGDYSNYVNHIIIEEVDKLEISYNFNNADYITRNINDNNILYKSYKLKDSNYVFYYPIPKTLPNEFGITAISKFLQFIIPTENYPNGVNIATENNYINAINHILSDPTFIDAIQDPALKISETGELVREVDVYEDRPIINTDNDNLINDIRKGIVVTAPVEKERYDGLGDTNIIRIQDSKGRLVAAEIIKVNPSPFIMLSNEDITRLKNSELGKTFKPAEIKAMASADGVIIATDNKDGVSIDSGGNTVYGRVAAYMLNMFNNKNIDIINPNSNTLLSTDSKKVYVHTLMNSNDIAYAVAEIDKLSNDTIIILSDNTPSNLFRYLNNTNRNYRVFSGNTSNSINSWKEVYGNYNPTDIILNVKYAKPKESQSFADETIHPYEGSNINLINKLAIRSDLSVYIGDKNNIFAKVVNNNPRSIVIPIDEYSIIARDINQAITKISSVGEITIIGDELDTLNIEQNRLNSIITKALRLVVINNREKTFTINTLNQSGISNAIRANKAGIHVDVYANVKSNNKFDITKAKYSEGFDIEGDKLLINNSDFNDINYMQSQINILIDSLKNIGNYAKAYTGQPLIYWDKLSEARSNLHSFGEVGKITDMNIDAINKALDINLSLIEPFVNHMSELDSKLDRLANDGVFMNLHTLSEDKIIAITRDIRQARHLSEIIFHLNELDEIDFSRGDTIEIANLNEKINKLKNIRNNAEKLIRNAVGYQSQILHGRFIELGSKPDFITRVGEIIKQYDDAGLLIGDDGKRIEMTPQQFFDQYQRLLVENEAMGWLMLNMDSAFNTGILLVDTVMKTYVTAQSEKNRKIIERIDKANAMFKDYFGQGIDRSVYTNSEADTQQFINKFINMEYGTLISKYNYSAFWEAQNAAYEKQNHAKNHITVLSNKLTALVKQFNNRDIDYDTYLKESNATKEEIARLKEVAETTVDNWIKENRVHGEEVKLSEEEKAKIEYYTNHYDDTVLQKYLNDKHIIFDKEVNEYVKIIPIDKYIDKKYATLNEKDIKFLTEYKALLKEIVSDTHGDLIVSDNFFPVAVRGTSMDYIKSMFGIKSINNRELEKGIMDELKYELDKPMMYHKYHRSAITYDDKAIDESIEEYEERVVNSVNKKFKTAKFKTLAEIEEYNEGIRKVNKEFIEAHREYNPISVMMSFINKSGNYKHTMDFENTMMLLMNEIKNGDYKEHKTQGWTKTVDSLLSKITGEKHHKTLSGTNTTAHTRSIEFLKAMYGVSNINNKADVAFSIARSVTSMVFMGGNLLGAIKNAAKGYHDILMESFAGEFIDGKSLTEAINIYRKSITSILADIHKEYSNDLTTAILKTPEAQELLELRDVNGEIISMKENREKILSTLNNAAYFGMNSTEHFMQYTMMLGMMKSHKIVQGKVINFNQFNRDIREKLLLEILDENQRNNYLTYKNKVMAGKVKFSDDYDTVSRWTEVKENMTLEQLSKLGERIKEKSKTVKAEFDKFEDVYSQFEVKDGRAKFKEGSKLDGKEYALFMNKVRRVNHELHGVYNKIDKMALRNMAFMDLALQFKSWVRPNMNRFYSQRWGRAVYSEGLQGYRKGVYISLHDFLKTPIRANKTYTTEQQTSKAAFMNIMNDYMKFILNAKLYYNRLPAYEQANINRALVNIVGILTTSSLLALAGLLIKPEDDDEPINSVALSLFIYELNMVHGEISQLLPYVGWQAFYRRSKENPLAAEKVLFDTYKAIKALVAYPFVDEEDRVYQTGPYKDKSKVEVGLTKITPIYRQRYKYENLQMYANWYDLYNPFSVFK